MYRDVCLITGGSGGLGQNLVKKFIDHNYKVVFTYHKNKPNNIPKDSIAFKVDLRKDFEIKNLFKKCKKYFNQMPNILINNAATSQEKPFINLSRDDINKMIDINLTGQIMITKFFLKEKKNDARRYRIINISSIGGQWGGKNQIHYAASKAGLINFTKSISNIYSDNYLTCNTVSIGLINTKMSKGEIYSKAGRKKIENIPIGRVGKIDEVANTVIFLASSEASYITGQCVNLNGGMRYND